MRKKKYLVAYTHSLKDGTNGTGRIFIETNKSIFSENMVREVEDYIKELSENTETLFITNIITLRK